jgi:hypothetical protein
MIESSKIWRCDLKSPCVKFCESENNKHQCGIKRKDKLKDFILYLEKHGVEALFNKIQSDNQKTRDEYQIEILKLKEKHKIEIKEITVSFLDTVSAIKQNLK